MIEKKESLEDIVLMDAEEVKTYGVRVKYVQFECIKCGKTWGHAFFYASQTIPADRLVCRDCNPDNK